MSVSFEIKSAQLPLVALLLKSPDLDLLARDVLSQFGPDSESPDFFDHDAMVLDFSAIPTDTAPPDLQKLLTSLRACRLVAVAVRGLQGQWLESAKLLGLVEAPLDLPRGRAEAVMQSTSTVEIVKEVLREVPGPATMVVDKPLRSGQKIYARGADLVVLAPVNQGAEVVADGNIHVYAPLRGKAMAGARGNTEARIFSICLEPELISIAGVYRTSENPLPADIQGKAAQVRLSSDGLDKLLIEALKT
jgi:septum site-determining protein MinC